MAVESPCTLVCTLDGASGWCFGCGRSGAEIADWSRASDATRRAILARLPARIEQLRDGGAMPSADYPRASM